ncbi:MAG: hypothetical protein IPH77_10410 [Ignavibacteria bacterium]|nr:hypothetical protein [Ignavibacteria bacterium]
MYYLLYYIFKKSHIGASSRNTALTWNVNVVIVYISYISWRIASVTVAVAKFFPKTWQLVNVYLVVTIFVPVPVLITDTCHMKISGEVVVRIK